MILIFNGPPGSGKDEAAAFFARTFNFEHVSFKKQLFLETIKHYNVDEDWFMKGYNNRSLKERKEIELGGKSRREAMIHVSEDNIKPKYGKDYFGRKVAEQIDGNKNYAISDGGFVEELKPIIDKVGIGSIVIVQLTRAGCSFSGDSRRYFNGRFDEGKEMIINFETEIEDDFILDMPADILTYRIHNNGTITDFYQSLISVEFRLKWLDGFSKALFNHPVRGSKIL